MLTLSDGTVLLGTASGYHRSMDDGESWIKKEAPSTIHGAVEGPDGIVLAWEYNKVLVSYDRGNSWHQLASVPISVHSVAVSPDNNFYYGGHAFVTCRATFGCNTQGGGLFESVDNGATWHEIVFPDTTVRRVIAPRGDQIYATDWLELASSHDGGLTWARHSFGALVHDLATTRDGLILIATELGLYAIDEDTGNPVPHGSLSSGILKLLVTAGGEVYALANSTTLRRSRDGGRTWRTIALPASQCTNFCQSQFTETQGGYLLIGTGMGVLRSTSAERTGRESDMLPPEHEPPLLEAYPNPFSTSTTLQFSLPTDGVVTLELYDLLGRKVSTLLPGYLSGGMQEIRVDGSSLASGVYLCRFRFNGLTQAAIHLVRK